MRSVADYKQLDFQGSSSLIYSAINTLGERFRSRPVAGILLFTDGNATDLNALDLDHEHWPPIYPVLLGSDQPAKDIRLERVAVSQTNFQAAPVSIQATIAADGFPDEDIVVQLRKSTGETIDQQNVKFAGNSSIRVQFRTKPEQTGLLFYELRVYARSEPPGKDGKPARTARGDDRQQYALDCRSTRVRARIKSFTFRDDPIGSLSFCGVPLKKIKRSS